MLNLCHFWILPLSQSLYHSLTLDPLLSFNKTHTHTHKKKSTLFSSSSQQNTPSHTQTHTHTHMHTRTHAHTLSHPILFHFESIFATLRRSSSDRKSYNIWLSRTLETRPDKTHFADVGNKSEQDPFKSFLAQCVLCPTIRLFNLNESKI